MILGVRLQSLFVLLRLYRSVILVFVFCLVVTNTTAQTNPQAIKASAATVFVQDKRLERVITVREVGVTIEELLHKLSIGNLILTAHSACKAQKLQLRLQAKPLRTVMLSLAKLLPGTWVPRGDHTGYTLYMEPAAVARRDRWWQLFLDERQRALEAQVRFILETMRNPHQVRALDENGKQDRDQTAETAKRNSLFSLLPASLQERIARQISDYEFLLGFHGSGFDEGAVTIPLAELPGPARDLVLNEAQDLMNINGSALEDVVVRFNNYGSNIATSVILLRGKRIFLASDTGPDLAVGISPEAVILGLDHTGLVKTVQTLGEHAPPVGVN